ncbi:MAG: class III signal peptide-containing protein [Methanothermobacter sp.]|jgi:uncharacterized protein (UPF0333 family)|nr:class III signal peptide-containing protein [Methanothermobacter sp.]HOQ19746.1 class III signal peptide-containing protein [Methanothermobacter sp.]
MDSKGQISLEYLLLVFVSILIIGSVTIPLIGKSIDASNDISKASDAKVAVQSMANAADIVYANGPGAKRTITFYMPNNGGIGFNNSKIYITVTYSNGTTDNIEAKTQYNKIEIDRTALIKGWHTATIKWEGNKVKISIL